MPNIKSIQLKTKELLTYFCGYRCNLVTIATKYVADAYCPKEAPCQIRSQYDLGQRSCKVRNLMSPFQQAKHHGTTSCYRKYLLLSMLSLDIGSTSCYRDFFLLSRLPLVIETTSCHSDDHLLSETPLVIESTSCYRKAFLSDSERHMFRSSFTLFEQYQSQSYQLSLVQKSMKNRQFQLFLPLVLTQTHVQSLALFILCHLGF